MNWANKQKIDSFFGEFPQKTKIKHKLKKIKKTKKTQ